MQPRDRFYTALSDLRSGISAVIAADEPHVIDTGRCLNVHAVNGVRDAMVSVARNGCWSFVLDLTRVQAMDSAGLGALVSAVRSVHDVGGKVGLVTRSAKVQRILELCARSRSCQIFSGRAQALLALRDSAEPRTAA